MKIFTYVITKEITAFVLYEEHFQAYRFHEDPANKSDCWRVLKFEELKSCYVSHVTDCSDCGNLFQNVGNNVPTMYIFNMRTKNYKSKIIKMFNVIYYLDSYAHPLLWPQNKAYTESNIC